MALDQNAKYPVGTLPATAAYPEGSAVNSTAPGALDGYPLEKDQLNDRFGLEQALLRAMGQAASGAPDTALVSQYLQGIIELASGRAFNYDETGIADIYLLSLRANQQGPASYFTGMAVSFIPGNDNAGASTINVAGLGAKGLRTSSGGTLPAGYLGITNIRTAVYDGVNFLIVPPTGGEYFKITDTKVSGTDGGSSSAATLTRDLNTINADTGGVVSVAANQFTLEPGTYRLTASAPIYKGDRHKVRLYNITDANYDVEGTSERSFSGDDTTSRSVLSAFFTITVNTTFELRHYNQTAQVTNGLGIAASQGDEIYAMVEGWRIR